MERKKFVDPFAKELTDNWLEKMKKTANEKNLDIKKDFRKVLNNVIKEEKLGDDINEF